MNPTYEILSTDCFLSSLIPGLFILVGENMGRVLVTALLWLVTYKGTSKVRAPEYITSSLRMRIREQLQRQEGDQIPEVVL